MERVDAGPHDSLVPIGERAAQFVSEGRLAGAAGPVHGDEHPVVLDVGDLVADDLQQVCPLRADHRIRVAIKAGQHPTSMHADPAPWGTDSAEERVRQEACRAGANVIHR